VYVYLLPSHTIAVNVRTLCSKSDSTPTSVWHIRQNSGYDSLSLSKQLQNEFTLDSLILTMKALRYFETSVTARQTTQRHISRDAAMNLKHYKYVNIKIHNTVTLSAALCGCETCASRWGKNADSRRWEWGSEGGEGTGGQRKFRNEELHDSYLTRQVTIRIKSRKIEMDWAFDTQRSEENSWQSLVGKPEEHRPVRKFWHRRQDSGPGGPEVNSTGRHGLDSSGLG
jgi:hypothetical protein